MYHTKSLRWIVSIACLLIANVGAVFAQSTAGDELLMGNPSGATTDVNFPSNYLMSKTQYAQSYHRDHGIPNWVSWHVGASDLGSAARCDCFKSDPNLPSSWYHVTTTSYTGSGYDRGHMCPSADRTSSSTANAATFYMSNILPQTADNNQGPWAALEDYCRSLISAGNELYIISGGRGSKGTIDSGRVQIPNSTWKVIMVLPNGSSDVSRVTTSTRLIAVDIPNTSGIRSANWKNYRTSVDQIESWTGYNFFSAVPSSIQSVIEAKVDNL